VIGNDCTGSCRFNYHTTTTAQVQLRWKLIVLLILTEFITIFVNDLRQVGGFLRVSSTNRTDRYDITEILFESGVKHHRRPVLVVEEARVPEENHRPLASNCKALSLVDASRVHPFCNLQSGREPPPYWW
jgi:hypothetical protein